MFPQFVLTVAVKVAVIRVLLLQQSLLLQSLILIQLKVKVSRLYVGQGQHYERQMQHMLMSMN